VVYLLKIDKEESFSKMIMLVASQIGKLMNYSNLTNLLGISIQTLKKYLWYAEKTFVVFHSNPFFTNKIKEITKSKIYYFYDVGLRNFSINLFGHFTREIGDGFLFQNFVANILSEKIRHLNYSLNFWRTKDKAEVDIVITKARDVLPIEVKYRVIKSSAVGKPLRSFIDKYRPKRALIINLDYFAEMKIKDTTVTFLPFHHLFTRELSQEFF
jgi:predicted AAA+ superfamily ATPase